MKISDQIKAARKAKGWTQEQLANAIDSYKANICEIEHGEYMPKYQTLQKLATALNVTFIIQPKKD